MRRSLLLIATSFAALLTVGSAFAGGSLGPAPGHGMNMLHVRTNARARTLYNQNNNDAGTPVSTQNFTSGINSGYDDQAADDFVVPQGRRWRIGEVDVTGSYFNGGSGPAKSVNIYFYQDNNGLPGQIVRSFKNLGCDDDSGSFACRLPKKVRLAAGHYWLSVVANCSFEGGCGQWGWELRSVISNDPAVWECPGADCAACPTWDTLYDCLGSDYNGDLMFDLKT